MTRHIRNWYSFLPSAVKELSLTRHAYYGGDTILLRFLADFEFMAEEDHYREILDDMTRDKLSSKETPLITLSNRAFQVNNIYGAVATLSFSNLCYGCCSSLPFRRARYRIANGRYFSSCYANLAHLFSDPEAYCYG